MLTLLLSFVLSHHTLTLTVRPSADAVEVSVEVGNEDYYRASTFATTDGRRVYPVTIRDLPSGEFGLWVTEMDREGHLSTTKRGFFVQ